MKCGHCKGQHDTVTEVRTCSNTKFSTVKIRPPADRPASVSKRQEHNQDRSVQYADFKVAAAEVPAGRYAISGKDGTTDFYMVDKPVEGRWKGYTFVKLQLSDDLQRMPMSHQLTVLLRIGADPRAAMERYGREIGECGHCGRTLTNEESREFGIGPVCRAKMGW